MLWLFSVQYIRLYVLIMSCMHFWSESILYSCLSVKELCCLKQEQYLKFVYKLSGCGSESYCSHFNFRYCSCFKQGVSWHSGNYRVWIHSEMHIWHDKNIQYLSCFALVLRGTHKKIYICQTVYKIPSILEFSPYSEIIHWCTTFKLTKC